MKKANEGWGGINLLSWCYLLPLYEEEEDDRMEGEMRSWDSKGSDWRKEKC